VYINISHQLVASGNDYTIYSILYRYEVSSKQATGTWLANRIIIYHLVNTNVVLCLITR